MESFFNSVQTGSSAFLKTFGTGLFDYLRQNVDAADAFNQGMTNVASMLAYAVLMAYNFAGISSIVDIGGSRGIFLEKIPQFNPNIRGTVFDTASKIERATQQLDNRALGRRCSYVSGDFFASVPEGADAYLLSGVIHDWDDDRAIRILGNCRRAMTSNRTCCWWIWLRQITVSIVSASFSI